MAGSFVYTDKVAANIVRLMVNKLVMTQFFSRKNERDFNEGEPIGDTLRVKKPNRGTVRSGFGYVGANINRQYTTITADQMFGIDCDWDTIDAAIKMERTQADINENILDPLAAQLSQECDSRAAQYAMLNTNMVVGALGTTPTTSATYTGPNTRMMEKAGMVGHKRAALIITPQMMESWIAGTPNLLTLFHPGEEVNRIFKKGYVGKYADFDVFTSMSLYPHTTGIWATVATGVTVTSSGQSGSSLAVTCTTGDTFNEGDTITIDAVYDVNPMTRQSLLRLKPFKIMASTVGVGGAATLTISPAIVGPGSPYQNVDALPLAAAVLTLQPGTTMANAASKTGKLAQALTNEAYGLVAIDLPMPKASAFDVVGKHADPETNINVGIIRAFDFDARSWKTRMDVWIGFGNFLSDNSACLIAGLQ